MINVDIHASPGKMVRREGHMETEHDLQQPQNAFNRAQATGKT